jgi:hypothetical protein
VVERRLPEFNTILWRLPGGRYLGVSFPSPSSRLTGGICVCDVEMYTPRLWIGTHVISDQLLPIVLNSIVPGPSSTCSQCYGGRRARAVVEVRWFDENHCAF